MAIRPDRPPPIARGDMRPVILRAIPQIALQVPTQVLGDRTRPKYISARQINRFRANGESGGAFEF